MVNLFIRLKQWNQERKFKNAINKADWMAKKSKMKFLVLRYNGRFLVKSKKELRKLIRDGYFVKGFTIQQAEKIALYITK
ncbi:MAG: hypothetical protein LBJ72_12530 [Dysgonamonadaceae bacterium]|jgi:hypothetical protein|nr:hypothetical protein [Dysgonamonadaceae bacterium]